MSAGRRAGAAAVIFATVMMALLAVAPAASAHALLLRTEPAPQSTVPNSPTSVRLVFSEAVEVAPGDVRVYDVDGKRVDQNKVTRSDGNKQVDIAVGHLADGTYTVTWHAVSADTHTVRGGFTFYVGHPSSISPALIQAETGAGRAVSIGYGVVRFCWFAALMLLIGLVAMRRWVWTPSVRAVRLSDSEAAARFRHLFAVALPVSWVVLAVAQMAQLGYQSATVAGTSVLHALGAQDLRNVLQASFGHLWELQAVLILVLMVPVLALTRPRRVLVAPDVWIATGAVLIGCMCVVAGVAGHARTSPHETLAIASIAVHLAAAGVWVGGLVAIMALGLPSWRLAAAGERPALLGRIVGRFSPIAMVTVGVIALTGVINAIAGFHAFSDLWRVPYGRVVLAKIVLLVIALVLAARHRFVTQPALAGPNAESEVPRFRWTATAELVALTGAVALAAALVSMVPGRTLALAANGSVNAQRQLGAYTVQLIVDPTAVGKNEIHVTYATAAGLAAGEVTNTTVTITPPTGPDVPVAVGLISPGHFVGDATLPDVGRYRLRVDGPGATTTFTFTIRKGA